MGQPSLKPESSANPEPRAGQYLTFRIGREEFAMAAAHVRGILPGHQVLATDEDPGSKSEAWLAGTAIFKSAAIPVVDLRIKLCLRRGIPGRNPCIVVVEIEDWEPGDFGFGCTNEPRLVGFLTDGVSDLVRARDRDFLHGRLRLGRARPVLEPSILLDNTRQLQVDE